MKKILHFVIGIIVLITAFNVYRHSVYYVGIGSLHAQKVARIAERINDPLVCSKIKKGFDMGPGPTESEMISTCYYVAGMEMNSVPFCNLMPQDRKNSCYVTIAVSQKDVKLCGSDALCISYFTRDGTDKTVCQNTTDSNGRDLCYWGVAKFNHDISICNNDIVSQHYKNQCYKTVAMDTGKSSLCNLIKDEDFEVNDCLRYISETYKK